VGAAVGAAVGVAPDARPVGVGGVDVSSAEAVVGGSGSGLARDEDSVVQAAARTATAAATAEPMRRMRRL
jgi:hypothetical protein